MTVPLIAIRHTFLAQFQLHEILPCHPLPGSPLPVGKARALCCLGAASSQPLPNGGEVAVL